MVKVLRELKMKGFSISWWFRDAIIRLINKDYGLRNIPALLITAITMRMMSHIKGCSNLPKFHDYPKETKEQSYDHYIHITNEYEEVVI